MNKRFFSGVPTDLDIKKLREMWPNEGLTVGDIIEYSDVETLLKIRRYTNRFKGVTMRWRKLVLKETPFVIGCERGVGFKVLSNSETADLSGDKLRYAAKAMRTSIILGSKVNTRNLTDEERARFDLTCSRSAKALATLQIKHTTIPLPEMNVTGRI